MHWTKAQVVKFGQELRMPFDLTWSCYNFVERACGKCGNCRDRLAAFSTAGVEDPISYEVR